MMPTKEDAHRDEHGRYHCTDGPAFSLPRSDEPGRMWHYWYVNQEEVHNWQEFQYAAKLSDEDMLVIRLKYPHFEGS